MSPQSIASSAKITTLPAEWPGVCRTFSVSVEGRTARGTAQTALSGAEDEYQRERLLQRAVFHLTAIRI